MIFANETQFHAWCFQDAWNNYPETRGRLFHVQQKATNAIEGNKFKAMGVLSGVTDFIYVGVGFVAFIELKWKSGTQFKAQKEFEQMVLDSGHMHAVVKSPDEWKTLMISFQS